MSPILPIDKDNFQSFGFQQDKHCEGPIIQDPNPFNDLPDELKLKIFKCAAGLNQPADRKTLACIRGICKDWNRLTDEIITIYWRVTKQLPCLTQFPFIREAIKGIEQKYTAFNLQRVYADWERAGENISRCYMKITNKLPLHIQPEEMIKEIEQAIAENDQRIKKFNKDLSQPLCPPRPNLRNGRLDSNLAEGATALWCCNRLSEILRAPYPLILPCEYEQHLDAMMDESLEKVWSRIQSWPDFREAQIPIAARDIRMWLQDPANANAINQVNYLNLSNLGLIFLPPEIGRFLQLEMLDLDNNQLKGLPPEIGCLVQLRWLYLCRNQLQSLPSEIGQLAHLQLLALNSNQLRDLPSELSQLAQLHTLSQ